LPVYIAYHLTIDSALVLPELVPSGEASRTPEIIIRLGVVEYPSAAPVIEKNCLEATPQQVCFSWEQVGLFLVQNGNEIVIEPAPEVEESALRLYLLGPVFATLLHQRGFLVLHASAVAVNGRGVGFLGGSGWGKSTLAAVFQARGHALIADDVIAVDTSQDAAPCVFPAFPQIKLWPEAAEAIGADPQTLILLHPHFEKRARRVANTFTLEPYPLTRLYILAEHDRPEPEIVRLPPQAALLELVRHSFLARLLSATGASESHFRQCAGLVQRVPVCVLRRRRSLADLSDLAHTIETDLMLPVEDNAN
jgi:hypothetical protein